MRVNELTGFFHRYHKAKTPDSLIATGYRGLRYRSASCSCSIAILEKVFEHVVDETSYDAFHDSFHDFFDALFRALTGFPQRYHPLS